MGESSLITDVRNVVKEEMHEVLREVFDLPGFQRRFKDLVEEGISGVTTRATRPSLKGAYHAEQARQDVKKMELDPNVPIHKQVELCLHQRKIDRRACSLPKGHNTDESGEEGHYWNLIVSDVDEKIFEQTNPQPTGLKVNITWDEEAIRRNMEKAHAGTMTYRETRNLISHTTDVVHLLVSDVGTLACAQPLGVGNGSFRKVTTDPETATCRDCKIGWVEYERDQYKEMWEKTERVLGSKLQELREAREKNITLQYQLDEMRRNAQGGH